MRQEPSDQVLATAKMLEQVHWQHYDSQPTHGNYANNYSSQKRSNRRQDLAQIQDYSTSPAQLTSNLNNLPQKQKQKTVAFKRIEQIENKLTQPLIKGNNPSSRFDMRYQNNI